MHIHGNILCREPRAFATRVSCMIAGIWAQLNWLIIRVKMPQWRWPKGKFSPILPKSCTMDWCENPHLNRCKTIAALGVSKILATRLWAKNQQGPPAKTEERKQKARPTKVVHTHGQQGTALHISRNQKECVGNACLWVWAGTVDALDCQSQTLCRQYAEILRIRPCVPRPPSPSCARCDCAVHLKSKCLNQLLPVERKSCDSARISRRRNKNFA